MYQWSVEQIFVYKIEFDRFDIQHNASSEENEEEEVDWRIIHQLIIDLSPVYLN